jgi:hypothetical protein
MRKLLVLTLVLSFAVSASYSSPMIAGIGHPQASTTAAPSMEVKAGLGIENLDLTGASDSFKIAPDTKIYAWTRVKGVAPGSAVSIAFKKGDKEVYRKEVTVPSVPFRLNTFRTFRAGDAGDWTIAVTGSDAKELAATTIKVEINK